MDEALTPTRHGQYLSVPEQFEQWTSEIQNLSPRMAYVKLHDQDPVKIKTLTVDEAKVEPKELERVLSTYRERYQRTKEEAEAAIRRISAPAAAERNSQNWTGSGPAYTKVLGRGGDVEDEEMVN